MNVLVIEDEARVAMFLVKGLRARDYTVEHVTNGRDALARIAAMKFSVVLLDLGLPDVDGFEVLRRLKEGGNSAPVIILTARTEERDRRRSFELGADDYVTKPFLFSDLVLRIRRLVDNGGDQQMIIN